ncbi:MAG: pyridoxal phosphate-dependent aminotransferase [Spirochaetaceae bacterium]|jgi:aspartate aminotransferase|nr:pyridoxal phosphate-dependent aminotransferase [Spirochaetaceae bacterium]
MPVSETVKNALSSSSMIRKMFEEGAALKKTHGIENVFDFSLGNPDLEPPVSFKETLKKLVFEDAPGSHGYMPNAGFNEVREAAARKVSRDHKVEIGADGVIMSVGAAGALNSVLKAILNPDDEVIVAKPFFMEYRPYALNHGGRLVEVASAPDFNLDVEAVKAALSLKTAAVLINSPNNPTGRVYPAKTIAELSRVLLEHGEACGRFPYLIADEPYREIVYGGVSVPPILSAYPHSIAATSFSKSLSLPGERIGYIAVSPKACDRENLLAGIIYATRTLGFVNAPALMQRCVAAVMDEKADVSVYEKRRDAFKKTLSDSSLDFVEPEGAFYIFARVPSKNGATGDDAAFSAHLKKHLILGVPGSSFGAKGWIRFAYCVSEKTILNSADAFKKAVSSFLP